MPSHLFRQWCLRAFGARIGRGVSIFRGTTVLAPENLVVGDQCSIGWRCVIDARGGITIADRVVIASDSQLVTGWHSTSSPTFEAGTSPIRLERYVWLATRSLVLGGVTMGEGSVAAAGAVVVRDVADHLIVGGVPARPIGKRPADLDYGVEFRPRFC